MMFFHSLWLVLIVANLAKESQIASNMDKKEKRSVLHSKERLQF
jgi:hypothetical protein